MILKREHIKQAVDAIGKRRPEIAYTLNIMLGKGRIDVPCASEASEEKRPYFLFSGRKAFVNKYQFFNDGTAPVEQALLLFYGEMAQKRALLHQEPEGTPGKHASQTDTAGLSLVIDYEIDRAAADLNHRIALARQKGGETEGSPRVDLLTHRLQRLEMIRSVDTLDEGFRHASDDPPTLFRGVIGDETKAMFMSFPFTRNSLMQSARLNLDYFHIRFLLNCLITGTEKLLFAGVAGEALQGLIFLELLTKPFYQSLEVKYIATRGGLPEGSGIRSMKGTGTFIMASTWMLWKSRFPNVKELSLDSEIEAERFYSSIGFHRRGLYRCVLTSPEGRLLTSITAMSAFSKKRYPSITHSLCNRVAGQVKLLRRRKTMNGKRSTAREFLKIAIHPAGSDLLARTTVRLLMKNRSRIPEGEALFALAKAFGRTATQSGHGGDSMPVAVVTDRRYRNHLQGIAHLENYRRIKAVEDVLSHRCLDGHWFGIAPRLAEIYELTWVHTPEYVAKVANTSGKKLSAFDFDTQTTEESWATARLAAGGLFSLLDAIMSGMARRGFAFIRPPGHHALPSRSMGFCIFNNVALGARYLKHRYGVSKLMIIDIDAHHGNGTQEVFYDTDEVLFVSIHESGSFPGTGRVEETGRGKGEGYTINIPLGKGSRARDIGRALYFMAGPVAQAYEPEMILVSFGFDLFIHDRLAGMKVTPNGYAILTALLLEMAERLAGGRIAFVMEGGYSIDGIRKCGLEVMKEVCNVSSVSREKVDNIRKSDLRSLAGLKTVINTHKKYWEVLQ
ncbi:histone deacetylase [Desulfoluna sp.]|uniref:histone deacetylase family protein n=1 Tax=Desulfoluna sp. TaxID=2045199 RepID=UPI002613B224|nr:histone deacetylase [Desulfoluna sp.]